MDTISSLFGFSDYNSHKKSIHAVTLVPLNMHSTTWHDTSVHQPSIVEIIVMETPKHQMLETTDRQAIFLLYNSSTFVAVLTSIICIYT